MRTMMVAGPRRESISDPFRLNLMIDGYFSSRKIIEKDLFVVHGAATGVDTMAATAAKQHGFTTQGFKVNAEDRKRALAERGDASKAPLFRTLRILETQEPDEVVAWWDGKTPGTGFTIREARRRGIPTEVIRI